MLSDLEIEYVIGKNFEQFLLNDYDEFSKDYEKTFVDSIEWTLMFDEYVSKLPDRDVADWIYREYEDYDDTFVDDDVKEIRRTISRRAELLLEREHKNTMYYLTHGGNKQCAIF